MGKKAAPPLLCLAALACSWYLALPAHPVLWPLPWGLMLLLAGLVLHLARQASAKAVAATGPEPAPSVDRQALIDISDALPIAVYHMENSPDGYRRFNFVSRRVESILGVSADEILRDQSSRWRHVNPEDLQRLQAHLAKTAAQAQSKGLNPPPFEFEFRLTRHGEERWTRVAALPIRFLPGEVSVWCGYYEDITERKRTELSLLTAVSEQNAILEAAIIGIAFVREGNIHRHNGQFATQFGAPAGVLAGRNIASLLTTDAWMALQPAAIQQATATGQTFTTETLLCLTTGTSFWAQVSVRAVYLTEPQRGELWLVRDITQRRRDHDALREAKEAAEDANRAKSEFLANMSHEIRTPLNTVIGLTHMLGETTLSPQQADYLHSIQRASRHLLRILNDILDLSKAESGRLHVEQVPFTLDSVLHNLEQLTRSKAHAKGLALVLEVAPDVPADLIGDPLRLGQILLNYTDNAIKFTEQGTVSVCVTREPAVATDDSSQVMLRFAVRDTGIGLSDTEAHRLFQNFTQADASTTRKFGGTGLGLAICKRLAALMGGQVGLDSTRGRGSTFWFTAALGLHSGASSKANPPPPMKRHVPASPARAMPVQPTVSSASFSPDSLKTAVAGLEDLLRQGDSEALDYLERHAAELQAALAAQFLAIQGHVFAFDFDAARALLDQWELEPRR